MYVLDTSALIEIINITPKGKRILDLVGNSMAATTSFSIHETLVGLSEKEAFVIGNLAHKMEIFPFTFVDAEKSSSIEKALLEKGTPINKVDVFIAGICISKQAELITLDKDFRKIPNLKILEI